MPSFQLPMRGLFSGMQKADTDGTCVGEAHRYNSNGSTLTSMLPVGLPERGIHTDKRPLRAIPWPHERSFLARGTAERWLRSCSRFLVLATRGLVQVVPRHVFSGPSLLPLSVPLVPSLVVFNT